MHVAEQVGHFSTIVEHGGFNPPDGLARLLQANHAVDPGFASALWRRASRLANKRVDKLARRVCRPIIDMRIDTAGDVHRRQRFATGSAPHPQ